MRDSGYSATSGGTFSLDLTGDSLGPDQRWSVKGGGAWDEPVPITDTTPDECTAGPFHDRQGCPTCLYRRDWARQQVDAVASHWGRLDLSSVEEPSAPSVGHVHDDVFLFTRGRRHNVYGKSETGKSRLCYCSAVREVRAGKAVVILNGEMADEDVLDWLMTSEAEPFEAEEILGGVFVYPSAGLLTDVQRTRILSDVAESGRELSLVIVDSATSVLSEAGLNPNDANDIEFMWREMGLWFTRLPDMPAFVVIDHVSKGAEGDTPTASIRKHNVVDTSLLVENVLPFRPTTQYGPAQSGFSTVRIKKGRRGGKDQVIARIIGHDERVWVGSPHCPVPWAKSRDRSGEPSEAEIRLLRAVAEVGDGSGSAEVLDHVKGNRSANNRLLQGLRDTEAEQGERSLLVVKGGRPKSHRLTERGWSYVAEDGAMIITPKVGR